MITVETEKVEIKKKKLKKWQKWLLGIFSPIVAIFVILLVIAIVDTVKFSNEVKNSPPATTSVGENKLTFETGEDDFVEADLAPVNINLSDSGLDVFEEYLDSITVEYKYSHLYNIDSAFSLYKASPFQKVTDHSHDVRVNGKIDVDTLFKRVKINNEKYLQEKLLYKEYSDEKVREYCTYLAENLEVIFEKYPFIDKDSVCCSLYDLKILISPADMAYAKVNDDLVFSITEERLENVLAKALLDTEDPFTETFYHEMMHICHMACTDYEKGFDWVVGVCRNSEQWEVNPLMWLCLEEASAEMMKSDCLDCENGNYSSKISYVRSLSYVLSLTESENYQLEYIQCSYDTDEFFKLFGADSDEEKIEVIKLMYTIEVLQSSPTGFYEAYRDEYGTDLKESELAEEDLRLEVKNDILLAFTKIFYSNLARRMSEGEVTLQDMLYLIEVYESDVNAHTSTYYKNISFAKPFFESYIGIQDKFFEIIAKENNMDVEDVKISFDNYSINVSDGDVKKSPNCDLDFLSAEKRSWINEFCKNIYRKGYPHIRKALEISKECEKAIKEG